MLLRQVTNQLALEGTARYKGLLIAPAEGFGLRLTPLLPIGKFIKQKKKGEKQKKKDKINRKNIFPISAISVAIFHANVIAGNIWPRVHGQLFVLSLKKQFF